MNLEQTLEKIKSHLWEWQVDWLNDQSEKKIWKKARQTGATSVASLEGLLHAWRHPGHRYFLLSRTVSQATSDILSIIKNVWLPAIQSEGYLEDAEVLRNKIRLSNNSVIRSQAGIPNKLRGKSNASFLCDEFAFWERRHLEDIESAIAPIVENNEDSVWRVISTPWDVQNNLYYDIWSNDGNRYSEWSRNSLDIYDAFESSSFSSQRDWTIEEKRKQKTQQEFATEYEGKFLRMSEFFFAKEHLNPLWTSYDCSLHDSEFHLGIDVAKIQDRTALVLIERWEDLVIVKRCRQMRGLRFRKQKEIMSNLIKDWKPDKVLCDATAHPALAEQLEGDHDNTFGLTGDRERKVSRTNELRKLTEQENILFQRNRTKTLVNESWQPSQVNLNDDLTKVKQKITEAGNVTFKVQRDDEGHGDSYSALLLSLHCAHHQTGRYLGSF